MTAESVAKGLGGRKAGGGWMARCPAHADRDPSLSIRDGENGRLLLRCFAGCPIEAIREVLRERGLWPVSEHLGAPRTRGARSGHRTPHLAPLAHPGAPEADAEAIRRTNSALAIWREAKPAAETLVEVYLRSRAIALAPPPSLRFARALRHAPTRLAPPCMIAAVQGPHGRIIGVHRTWLAHDGSSKAPIPDAKMSLGPIGGGAVRLALAGPVLAVAEGIETALSAQQAVGLPTWAALSAGGIESLILPPFPLAAEVIVFADHDASGRGQRAAETAAARWHAEGRRVRIALPAEPGADFNDVLNAVDAARGAA